MDIPATAPAPGQTVLQRTAASLRTEAIWRQLAYQLLAGPLLAAGGLLTLAAWAGGAGMAAAFAYGFRDFGSGQHQFQSPKPLIALHRGRMASCC